MNKSNLLISTTRILISCIAVGYIISGIDIALLKEYANEYYYDSIIIKLIWPSIFILGLIFFLFKHRIGWYVFMFYIIKILVVKFYNLDFENLSMLFFIEVFLFLFFFTFINLPTIKKVYGINKKKQLLIITFSLLVSIVLMVSFFNDSSTATASACPAHHRMQC